MAVVVIQHNDGVQSGGKTLVQPVVEGETDRELLQRKAASHERIGYIVRWHGPDRFDARKDFPSDRWVSRKDRFFRIE